jgi:hypothetical protein
MAKRKRTDYDLQIITHKIKDRGSSLICCLTERPTGPYLNAIMASPLLAETLAFLTINNSCVLPSSAVDCGFKHRYYQTKDYKIGILLVFALTP